MIIMISLPQQHQEILEIINLAGISINNDTIKDLYDTLLLFSYRYVNDMNFDIMNDSNISMLFSNSLENFMYNTEVMYEFLEAVLETLKYFSDFIVHNGFNRNNLIVSNIIGQNLYLEIKA